jgi:hypothetical protein
MAISRLHAGRIEPQDIGRDSRGAAAVVSGRTLMDEAMARDVVIVRALETADGAREIWSDADRMWAGRAAAEAVGAAAPPDSYLARRATLVLERFSKRHPRFVALTRRSPSPGWLGPVAAAGAFIIGAAGADLGPAHRINLLAPPVLALLAWNLAVYVALLSSVFVRHGRIAEWTGPLRRNVVAWLRDVRRPMRKPVLPPPLAAAFARFSAQWSLLAAPLWRDRAAAVLHTCAATLAAGAIAGLYVRGIALEYRAGWQSTFLDATDVARLLNVVLAPGAWLTGIAVPDADHLRTLAGDSIGENAAMWIHLYAATLLLLVIAPRAALATGAWISRRRLASRFPLALDEPYFQRLLRGWQRGTARVVALAYSYDVPQRNADGLAQVLTRALESAVDIQWRPAVAYGADDLPEVASGAPAAVVVVFNLSATPERETHGAFVRALAAQLASGAPLVAVVDASDFTDRFDDHPRRIAERRDAWERALAEQGVDAVFVRLASPDLAQAGAALARRLEVVTPGTPHADPRRA